MPPFSQRPQLFQEIVGDTPARLDGTIGMILKEWGHVERVA